MSFQVYCLCSSNFADIFTALLTVLGFYPHGDKFYVALKVISVVLNFTSFFAIAAFALGVSQENEKVRRKLEEIAFVLCATDETKKQGELFYRFIKLKKKLILSAWGVFSFSIGFLLTSTGVLITYNLLLLQLDTYRGNLDNQQSHPTSVENLN
ncbi:hypothetical protein AVEN_275268-1 [Araneus ventricosus]|uniref:Uncharacterized protein n=1 Tax=Araneus ventricosus TaxID=182803 RepID=A0A4Y2UY23_ARAVE|nr:hypothetical protein AVEN_275268-1 [Araneus ventricosus]